MSSAKQYQWLCFEPEHTTRTGRCQRSLLWQLWSAITQCFRRGFKTSETCSIHVILCWVLFVSWLRFNLNSFLPLGLVMSIISSPLFCTLLTAKLERSPSIQFCTSRTLLQRTACEIYKVQLQFRITNYNYSNEQRNGFEAFARFANKSTLYLEKQGHVRMFSQSNTVLFGTSRRSHRFARNSTFVREHWGHFRTLWKSIPASTFPVRTQ